MKPAAFDYVRPPDIKGALAALAGSDGGGKLIAGGQSLGPMLNLRLARPRLLIDVSRMAELRAVEDRGHAWRIGAAVTHAQIEDGAIPIGAAGFLSEVARRIAYRAVRNRGTIGGSLAHADPAADWPLALSALDATVEVRGPGGDRRLKVAELPVAAFTTVLADDEIIVAVEVPKPSRGVRWGMFKLCRKVGEFPIAATAVMVDGARAEARVVLGALGDRPRPLRALAQHLLRNGIDGVSPTILAQAVAEAAPELDAVDHRIHVACLTRAVAQAFDA